MAKDPTLWWAAVRLPTEHSRSGNELKSVLDMLRYDHALVVESHRTYMVIETGTVPATIGRWNSFGFEVVIVPGKREEMAACIAGAVGALGPGGTPLPTSEAVEPDSSEVRTHEDVRRGMARRFQPRTPGDGWRDSVSGEYRV